MHLGFFIRDFIVAILYLIKRMMGLELNVKNVSEINNFWLVDVLVC